MPGPEPPDRDLLDRHLDETLLSSFLFCTDLAKVCFLISFFAMIFLVFCDVNVCFFFDIVGENVYRDICKLKRSLNVL